MAFCSRNESLPGTSALVTVANVSLKNLPLVCSGVEQRNSEKYKRGEYFLYLLPKSFLQNNGLIGSCEHCSTWMSHDLRIIFFPECTTSRLMYIHNTVDMHFLWKMTTGCDTFLTFDPLWNWWGAQEPLWDTIPKSASLWIRNQRGCNFSVPWSNRPKQICELSGNCLPSFSVISWSDPESEVDCHSYRFSSLTHLSIIFPLFPHLVWPWRPSCVCLTILFPWWGNDNPMEIQKSLYGSRKLFEQSNLGQEPPWYHAICSPVIGLVVTSCTYTFFPLSDLLQVNSPVGMLETGQAFFFYLRMELLCHC